VEVARKAGLLAAPDELFVPLESAASLPPEKTLILATGSQAEPRSTLSLMLDEERAVRVRPGDLVILSARPIPGNERAVGALIDQLTQAGARVVHGVADPTLHVSGHASRPQQRRMLEAVRPRNFVPIHGEVRHLHAHLQTALEAGVLPEHALVARDGEVLELGTGRVQRAGVAPAGRMMRDRYGEAALRVEAVADRRKLAERGVVFASLVVDRSRLTIVAGPALTGRGLNDVELAVLPRAAEEARRFLAEVSPSLYGDEAFLQDQLLLAVRRAFKQYTAKRPLVVPQVIWL
jgi:ribonuclease J